MAEIWVGRLERGTDRSETSASGWCVSSFSFFFYKQLLLKFHLFLPSPPDRITSPLVTLCARSHKHTLFHEPLSSSDTNFLLSSCRTFFSPSRSACCCRWPSLALLFCLCLPPKHSFSPAFISTSSLPPSLPTFSLPSPFGSPSHYCVQIF